MKKNKINFNEKSLIEKTQEQINFELIKTIIKNNETIDIISKNIQNIQNRLLKLENQLNDKNK